MFEINSRQRAYSSIMWNVLEYLGLFLIVMLHEFGHSLACRQVGGTADTIVLWPLGGVAYVDPPPRPGATLWAIAAGPLVNVALFPIFLVLYLASRSLGWAEAMPDLHRFLYAALWTNGVLLAFNMLPIYPLDGGQILRSLLWFVLGRARSLMAAAGIGIIGALGFIALALRRGDTWLAIISVFVLINCWEGVKRARALSQMAKVPRRDGFACPSCKSAPPLGDVWRCSQCSTAFDTFQTQAVCPQCAARFDATRCLDCGRSSPMSAWLAMI